MRPVNSSEVSMWKSPVTYLFGGLALILALISVALVILVCSHRKRASHSSSSSSSFPEQEGEEGGFRLQVMAMADSEPKILVIMAGDDRPTYLAQPIVPLSYCTCQPEPNPSSSTSICNGGDQKIGH